MSQPISLQRLGAGTAAGYEEPFEMLAACHERVDRMLRLLQRLRTHVRSHGGDDQARQAARDVMRYFDLAAPQHHLDEERHVLPALQASGDAALQALARRLQADHRRMEQGWADCRAILGSLSEGALPALEPAHEGVLQAFADLYAGHIVAEESLAFPRAQQRLDSTAIEAMAHDMMRRRGVT